MTNLKRYSTLFQVLDLKYRIKCTSIQKGWYNNMKWSVKKRADKKALFTTEAVSACTVFV